MIWTHDEWLSAPLAMAMQRLGYTVSTIACDKELPKRLTQHPSGPVILLIGPKIPLDDIETAVAPIAQTRTVGGICFTNPVSELDAALPPGYQTHDLPPDLHALHQTIQCLIGVPRNH